MTSDGWCIVLFQLDWFLATMVRMTCASSAKPIDFEYLSATCKSLYIGVDLACVLGVCVSLCVWWWCELVREFRYYSFYRKSWGIKKVRLISTSSYPILCLSVILKSLAWSYKMYVLHFNIFDLFSWQWRVFIVILSCRAGSSVVAYISKLYSKVLNILCGH
jgi:hypothetical protein